MDEELDHGELVADDSPMQGSFRGFGLVAEVRAAVEKEFDDLEVSVFGGPEEASLQMVLGGGRDEIAVFGEEGFHDGEAPGSAGGFEVEACAAGGEEGGGTASAVGEAAEDRGLMVACAAGALHGCAAIEQEFEERYVYAGAHGMDAGGGEAEDGAGSAIGVGCGFDIGAGI